MAIKKTPTRSKINSKKAPSPQVSTPSLALAITKSNRRFLIQIVLVILLGVTVFFVVKKYRGFILAGTVNSTPISRWQLTQKLVQQYGKATLEEMVSETLLNQLADKNEVTVTPQDVQSEIQKITDQLGGEEALGQTLEQYGMTRTDLDARLQISLKQQKLAEKLFADKVSLTEEEVKQAFEANQDFYQDKTFEDVKSEVEQTLKQQKFQQEFITWFEAQKTAAKINTYI